MANSPMTRQQVRDKIEWEGGIMSTLSYGLRPEDIADHSLATLWGEARDIHAELNSVLAEIREVLQAA